MGSIRIGSVSSLAWSVVLPSIFRRPQRTAKGASWKSYRVRSSELPRLLKQGRIDLMVTAGRVSDQSLEEFRLGQESYVLVESIETSKRSNIYLDHDENDQITTAYLKNFR